VDKYATGGDSGHTGPGNNYAAGPLHPANSALWIVCYVNGQSITNSHSNDTTTIWDLATDGYYYTDAWLYTGINGPAVPHC
jgi:LasA protease